MFAVGTSQRRSMDGPQKSKLIQSFARNTFQKVDSLIKNSKHDAPIVLIAPSRHFRILQTFRRPWVQNEYAPDDPQKPKV